MSIPGDEFYGFEKIAAKKSERVNKLLKSVISSIEWQLNYFTSTPKAKVSNGSRMDICFSKFCEDALKHESNLQIMDYDSGYMSHHQESNSDSSLEHLQEGSITSCASKSIFLSEDALLEKPEVNIKLIDLDAQIEKEDFEETRRLFNSPDEDVVIHASITSVQTSFSGFSNDSSCDSNESIDIAQIPPIVYNDEMVCTNDSANCTLNDTDDNIIIINNVDLPRDPQINASSSSELTADFSSSTNHFPLPVETQCDIKVSKFMDNSVIDVQKPLSVLNNVTNVTTPQVLEEKPEKTDIEFDCENKENIHKCKTPNKLYSNPVDPKYSPDLFDEEPLEVGKKVEVSMDFVAEEKYIIKKDCRLLKRVQTGLSGVLPPPSVTTLKLTVGDMLSKLIDNKDYFWTNTSDKSREESEKTLNMSDESNCEGSKSLMVTVNGVDDFSNKQWPEILEDRYHGLHFNRSKISEEFELLCDKFGQRCVGSETQSSCTVFENTTATPGKKKIQKSRWLVKSPGRRLSHLARRRITFSSANLQAGGSSMAGMRARQIMVDAKKLDLVNRRKSPGKSPRKTPKKTPNKSPKLKTRTPSSSAKKKLAMRFRKLTGEFEKTVPSTSSENFVVNSKRALFQSPSKTDKSMFMPSTSGLSTFQKDVKKGPTKRALFTSPLKYSPKKRSPFKISPFKKSPSRMALDKKRKRTDSEEINPSKFLSASSVDIKPSESEVCKSLIRSKSELNVSKSLQGELSEIHKKKLQWAVYEALRSQNITPSHTQFKVFASILARVTRKFFLHNSSRTETGTSERMLRIARHHVYAVLKGKSVDEIVNEYLKNRAKTHRPQGYVGIEEFNRIHSTTLSVHKENILQDRLNTISSNEKRKLEQLGKSKSEEKVERIKKVINFGDDHR